MKIELAVGRRSALPGLEARGRATSSGTASTTNGAGRTPLQRKRSSPASTSGRRTSPKSSRSRSCRLRFPFVAFRRATGLRYWGRTPQSTGGRVTLQAKQGGKMAPDRRRPGRLGRDLHRVRPDRVRERQEGCRPRRLRRFGLTRLSDAPGGQLSGAAVRAEPPPATGRPRATEVLGATEVFGRAEVFRLRRDLPPRRGLWPASPGGGKGTSRARRRRPGGRRRRRRPGSGGCRPRAGLRGRPPTGAQSIRVVWGQSRAASASAWLDSSIQETGAWSLIRKSSPTLGGRLAQRLHFIAVEGAVVAHLDDQRVGCGRRALQALERARRIRPPGGRPWRSSRSPARAGRRAFPWRRSSPSRRRRRSAAAGAAGARPPAGGAPRRRRRLCPDLGEFRGRGGGRRRAAARRRDDAAPADRGRRPRARRPAAPAAPPAASRRAAPAACALPRKGSSTKR